MNIGYGIGMLLALTSSAALAATVHVPEGARLALSSGELRAACADLQAGGLADGGSGALRIGDVAIEVGGALAGGSAQIEVGGDWHNAGTFIPGSGAVAFVDGCAASATLSGDLEFNDLAFHSTSGRSIALPAGRTVTVAGHLHVDTGAGAPDISSSSLAQAATICLLAGATANVSPADLAPGNVQLLDNGCAGGGAAPAQPLIVPAVSSPSLFALIALLLALGLPLAHRRIH